LLGFGKKGREKENHVRRGRQGWRKCLKHVARLYQITVLPTMEYI